MDFLQHMMKGTELKDRAHTFIDTKTRVDEQKLPPSPTEWKRIGNQHLAFKRYKDAISAYTKGIEEGDNSIDILANRSCAYLHLLKYQCALTDAEAALTIDKYHIKCIHRKIKALFGLALYKDAKTFLEKTKIDSIPKNDRKIITDLMAETDRYIAQSEKADYPWNDIYREQSTDYDMADYTNSVTVKEAPMKGRGLFATKLIKAGNLVLATKAFTHIQDNSYPNCQCHCSSSSKHVKGVMSNIQDKLVEEINEILKEYPHKFEAIGKLYAGPELGYLKSDETTFNESRDSERIKLITGYNSITYTERLDGSPCVNAGLWIIPSFINHNCVDANSSWMVKGGFLFIRAFKDISDGEEIEMAYRMPTELIAQERLDNYNFICECRLCKRDRSDDSTIKATRASLYSQLQKILCEFDEMSKNFRKHHDIEIQRIIELFDQTRRDAPELNLCIVAELFEFAKIRFGANRISKSIATFEKVYKLIENVAGFELYTIFTCFNIILAYTMSHQKKLANSWIENFKKKTRLFFGSLLIIHLWYQQYITLLRDSELDI